MLCKYLNDSMNIIWIEFYLVCVVIKNRYFMFNMNDN